MISKRQRHKAASVERHEISRLLVTEQPSDSDDRVRFLRMAAIALDGPDERPYAEQKADHDGLIWNRQLKELSETRRRACELLHYTRN